MIGPWRLSNGVKPEACKDCPRYERGNGFVPCNGPPDADILVVGRHPGPSEGRTGKPYSGPAGHLLDGILFRAGLRRTDMLITNLVKCSGPEPTHEEITYCRDTYLVEELPGRKCIVTMGALPGQYLAGVNKIRRERGTVRSLAGTPVVVTLEPAGLLWSKSEAKNLGETRDYLPIVIKDFVKVKRIAAGKPHITEGRILTIDPTDEQVQKMTELAKQHGKCTTDLETSFFKDGGRNITWVGLSVKPDFAIAMSNWRRYRELLQTLYGDDNIQFICHNAQFDPFVLEEQDDFSVTHNRYDTMLADHMIESDMGDFGLEAVVSRHLDYEPWKEELRQEADYWGQRNVRDVATTAELESVLTPRMEELGVKDLFYRHQMPMAEICHNITKTGINVNEDMMMKTGIACSRLAERAEDGLAKMHGILFNPRSPAQLKEVLYGSLKLPIQLHRRTRKPTTDHYALEDLEKYIEEPPAGKAIDPRAKDTLAGILTARKYGKLANTFSSGEHLVNGRVHAAFLQHRAVTGRQSSQGPNMHQVPKGIMREMYIPDTEDDIFIEADFSQIEMRLAAWFSRCQRLLDMFAQGIDVHVTNAQRFYGLLEPGETRRSLAKNMFYGIMYGQGKSGLATMYGCSVQHAESFINFIFTEYPELKRWRNGLLNTVEDANFLRNPYGRIRWLWNRGFATEAYIYLPQSTGFDVLAEAAIELHDRLPEPARICLMVHDSIMVHCPAEMRDEVQTLIKECMTRPRDILDGYSFPIKMGAGTDYDKASHEEGLAGDWRRLRRTI